jgi:hypothetical protein
MIKPCRSQKSQNDFMTIFILRVTAILTILVVAFVINKIGYMAYLRVEKFGILFLSMTLE